MLLLSLLWHEFGYFLVYQWVNLCTQLWYDWTMKTHWFWHEKLVHNITSVFSVFRVINGSRKLQFRIESVQRKIADLEKPLLYLYCANVSWTSLGPLLKTGFAILVYQVALHRVFKSQLFTLIGPSNVKLTLVFNNCLKTWEAKFSHSRQFWMIIHSNFPDCNWNQHFSWHAE